VVGLGACTIPLVLPRAHDCITLFLGSKERYVDYFFDHPGVFFKTTGWLERGHELSQHVPDSIQTRSGMIRSHDEMVARYGEDNARFLAQQLGNMTHNYRQITFIEMGVEPDDRLERQARAEAAARGWKFERLRGNLRLLEKLVDGQWDEEDFLVVAPGERIASSYDERIVRSEPPPSSASTDL